MTKTIAAKYKDYLSTTQDRTPVTLKQFELAFDFDMEVARVKLAIALYTTVYGSTGAIPDWDITTRDNYVADAEEILKSHPHLLPLDLRLDI